MPLSESEVRLVVAQLLAADIEAVEFPGGASREAVRVSVTGQGMFVTRRKSLKRAKLEAGVLRILNQSHAPVPHLIGWQGRFLIQQDVGSQRLSQCLQNASNHNLPRVPALLESALLSLHALHQLGAQSKLLGSLPVLGLDPQWLATFVRSAGRLGKQLELPSPQLDYEKLGVLLEVKQPAFIKWDARPGNAVVRDGGQVIWFDWEHCGRRHPLDDVAWLLTDEYTPYLSDAEEQLIMKTVPAFANGYSQARALEYLYVYGTFDSCIRLAMILHHQAKGGWLDYDYCLAFDKVGVVKTLAIQVCHRAARWAQHSELTKDLTPWFGTLQDKLQSA